MSPRSTPGRNKCCITYVYAVTPHSTYSYSPTTNLSPPPCGRSPLPLVLSLSAFPCVPRLSTRCRARERASPSTPESPTHRHIALGALGTERCERTPEKERKRKTVNAAASDGSGRGARPYLLLSRALASPVNIKLHWVRDP